MGSSPTYDTNYMAIKKTPVSGDYPETARRIKGYLIQGEEARISNWLKARAKDCMKNVKIIPIKKLK